ncbi:MAG TPA: DegT/DnrJ/EryC1/StrS family aminotransferase [Tepidisphaeraceae bacterium]|jgi:dTDP-4-amino-4,6-dideoxygalactose transaminase
MTDADQSPPAELALFGGPPAVTLDATEANRWPILTAEDEQAVLDVMRDGDISTHRVTRDLEDDYRQYFGVSHALSHCNGTAALLAAFFAIDLQPGDEVIVPSATWWASISPMLWLGAVPVFAETESEQMGLDPQDVQRKITPRTRAIVVVHLWGMPSRMAELLELARRHDLRVIEDASHAHGARWQGRLCGTLGDVGVFSLQGAKLAPAGEGGILLTGDAQLHERAALLGDVVRVYELPGPARRFAATGFGMKTRMSPLNAAIARVQLRHLDERNARRCANIRHLSAALEPLGFDTFRGPPDVERVYFEFLIRADPQRTGLPIPRLIEALVAEGCAVRHPRYPLVHEQPFFTEGACARIARLPPHLAFPQYRADDLPQTRAANALLISLPSFPSASRELLDQYALAFRKVSKARARLEPAMHHGKRPHETSA